MPCLHLAWSGEHCLRWGSPSGRWLRPIQQHTVFVSLWLLIRRSVPNLEKWSPSIDKIKHILSVIHYTICGAVCFQFTHFCCDDWENIYTLSYYHHQIGSMNYYPLLRVSSWSNGIRCMYFYILKSSSFIFPFRHKKLSWLLKKRHPVPSAILLIVSFTTGPFSAAAALSMRRVMLLKVTQPGAGDPLCLVQEFSSYLFNRKFLCSHLFRREWWHQRTHQYLVLCKLMH